MEDTLFKYKQLSDFEKLLFCEKQNKELKIAIGKYQSSTQELLYKLKQVEADNKNKSHQIAEQSKKITHFHNHLENVIKQKEDSKISKLNKKIQNMNSTIANLRKINSDLISKLNSNQLK